MNIENAGGPDNPILCWPGSGSAVDGLTAFGVFEEDDIFATIAPQVAASICSTLGFPFVAVELDSQQIYQNFEFSIMKFSSMVNEFNVRENLLGYQGMSTGSSFSQTLIRTTPIPMIVELAADYGTEAEVGGTVNLKRGYITMNSGQSEYDLQGLWAAASESGNRLEIRRVFYEKIPTMERIYSGFAGNGMDMNAFLGTFGFQGMSMAVGTFQIMPEYQTVLQAQALELNDEIRDVNYSFQIHNNKVKIFPLPDDTCVGSRIWFEYYVAADKFGASATGSSSDSRTQIGVVSDFSNVPFSFVPLVDVNDIGRMWIYEYTLAKCKITLGNIRRKYAEMPIPNATVQLDGELLRQEGQSRIDTLETQLRESLESSGKAQQLSKAVENEQNSQEILKLVPMKIYIF